MVCIPRLVHVGQHVTRTQRSATVVVVVLLSAPRLKGVRDLRLNHGLVATDENNGKNKP